jgi:interleukin-1 receptor-associated kinase 4
VDGTQAYMAPEYFRGQIGTPCDVYSYGMVLLELLSNLKVMDRDRRESEMDLLTYLSVRQDEANFQKSRFFAPNAGWKKAVGEAVFDVAWDCLKLFHAHRPTMTVVLDRLEPLERS